MQKINNTMVSRLIRLFVRMINGFFKNLLLQYSTVHFIDL